MFLVAEEPCRRPQARDQTRRAYTQSAGTTSPVSWAIVATFEHRVVDALRRLPPGEVVTYGEIAEEAGSPGAARAVGNVLARVEDLPWWRVVNAAGRLAPGHERTQARLLRDEGVPVRAGRVIQVGSRRRAPRAGG